MKRSLESLPQVCYFSSTYIHTSSEEQHRLQNRTKLAKCPFTPTQSLRPSRPSVGRANTRPSTPNAPLQVITRSCLPRGTRPIRAPNPDSQSACGVRYDRRHMGAPEHHMPPAVSLDCSEPHSHQESCTPHAFCGPVRMPTVPIYGRKRPLKPRSKPHCPVTLQLTLDRVRSRFAAPLATSSPP